MHEPKEQRIAGLGGVSRSNNNHEPNTDDREIIGDDMGYSVKVGRADVGAGGGSTDMLEKRVGRCSGGGANGWSRIVGMLVGLESKSVISAIVEYL